jgi:hypothetical protein
MHLRCNGIRFPTERIYIDKRPAHYFTCGLSATIQKLGAWDRNAIRHDQWRLVSIIRNVSILFTATLSFFLSRKTTAIIMTVVESRYFLRINGHPQQFRIWRLVLNPSNLYARASMPNLSRGLWISVTSKKRGVESLNTTRRSSKELFTADCLKTHYRFPAASS